MDSDPNLDPDADLDLDFRSKCSLKIVPILKKNNNKQMPPREIFTQLSLWMVNLYLKSYIFCRHFILYLHIWIRIRIPNMDPDPESSWLGILIHNTDLY